MRVVVESPMKGKDYADLHRNLRYAAWCCRAEVEEGNCPIASHLFCPLFMNDRVPDERKRGMSNEHFWQPDVPHHIYHDHDIADSDGTSKAANRCVDQSIPYQFKTLPVEMWQAFNRGEWPPHTEGCSLGPSNELFTDEHVRELLRMMYRMATPEISPTTLEAVVATQMGRLLEIAFPAIRKVD